MKSVLWAKFQASVALYLRTSLSWNVTRPRSIVAFRRFGTLIPYSREKKSEKKKCFSLGEENEDCPEISVNNYQYTL